ncbi:MAG: hypothetical protein ABR538_10985 [Candidatus Binatia bacterium]
MSSRFWATIAVLVVAVSGAAQMDGPDLVARRIYAESCTENCVFAPGTAISLVAFVTNESWTATGQPFGAKLRIHRDGETPSEAEAASAPGKPLYRYHWDNLDAQSAAKFSWDRAWIPKEVGTYRLVLQVDDFKGIDANESNDLRELSVVITDSKEELKFGVADGVGGSVTFRGEAGGSAVCESAACQAAIVSGGVVDLEAVPNRGFQFVRWEGERAGNCIIHNFVQTRCQLVMNGPKAIVARFSPVVNGEPAAAPAPSGRF